MYMSSISNHGGTILNGEIYNPFIENRRRKLNVLIEMIKNGNLTTKRDFLKYCMIEFGVRLDTAKSYFEAVTANENVNSENNLIKWEKKVV